MDRLELMNRRLFSQKLLERDPDLASAWGRVIDILDGRGWDPDQISTWSVYPCRLLPQSERPISLVKREPGLVELAARNAPLMQL